MKLCSKCNKKIGLLEGKQYINDNLFCIDCYTEYQDEQNRIKMEMEAKKQREEEELKRKEREKYQKMSIQELIRGLGNENEKRMAMEELGKRKDVTAVNAVWEAMNLEGGFDYDWRYNVYLDTLPIIGELGSNDALNEMIKMSKMLKEQNENVKTTLNDTYDAIEGYKNNPDPAPEATEAYNECISQLDWLKDIIQKSQTIVDALDEASDILPAINSSSAISTAKPKLAAKY